MQKKSKFGTHGVMAHAQENNPYIILSSIGDMLADHTKAQGSINTVFEPKKGHWPGSQY